MTTKGAHSLFVLLAVAAMTVAAFAQDTNSSKQPVSLSGTYTVASANVGQTEVSMDFSATITNTGATDAVGPIVLRHPNDISKVFYRFGDQSIAPGKSVTIRSNVSMPRRVYDGWLSGGGPALFFYTKNDRGDIKTFQIPLSATKAPPSATK